MRLRWFTTGRLSKTSHDFAKPSGSTGKIYYVMIDWELVVCNAAHPKELP